MPGTSTPINPVNILQNPDTYPNIVELVKATIEARLQDERALSDNGKLMGEIENKKELREQYSNYPQTHPRWKISDKNFAAIACTATIAIDEKEVSIPIKVFFSNYKLGINGHSERAALRYIINELLDVGWKPTYYDTKSKQDVPVKVPSKEERDNKLDWLLPLTNSSGDPLLLFQQALKKDVQITLLTELSPCGKEGNNCKYSCKKLLSDLLSQMHNVYYYVEYDASNFSHKKTIADVIKKLHEKYSQKLSMATVEASMSCIADAFVETSQQQDNALLSAEGDNPSSPPITPIVSHEVNPVSTLTRSPSPRGDNSDTPKEQPVAKPPKTPRK